MGRRAPWPLVAVLAGCALGSVPPPEPPALDPDLVQHGAMLFLSPAVSADGSRSCATCHPGGGTNGRAYRGGEEVPPGSPGARDVRVLWGLWQRGPYLADGSAATAAEALDHALREHMGGASMAEVDRDALEVYLLSLPPFDRRRVDETGLPIEPATRSALDGAAVFRRAGCAKCHPPPRYTREGQFDVGSDGRWTVPCLRGVSTTPPYGHDGRWATLQEAVLAILRGRGETLSDRDLRQLLAYLELL